MDARGQPTTVKPWYKIFTQPTLVWYISIIIFNKYPILKHINYIIFVKWANHTTDPPFYKSETIGRNQWKTSTNLMKNSVPMSQCIILSMSFKNYRIMNLLRMKNIIEPREISHQNSKKITYWSNKCPWNTRMINLLWKKVKRVAIMGHIKATNNKI